MGIAIRRHHRERLKNKRKHYHTSWAGRQNDAKRISFYVETPCPCSCSGCGNPRHHKWHKAECLTLQERRFKDEKEYDDLDV